MTEKSPHDKLLDLASDCGWEFLHKFYVARNLEVGKLEDKIMMISTMSMLA